MTTDVRIFGMHKAGTSFLMKALSHFCHRNKVALASSPFGMLPLQAYDKWEGGMEREALDAFLAKRDGLVDRIQAFSGEDIKGDVVGDRLAKAEIYSIGDGSNDKRVLFYRNSSIPVWEMDDAPAVRVIRNPLSIVKSAYFSHLKTHSTLGWSRLERQRQLLSDMSRDEGMWKTYEFLREDMFFHMTEGPLKTLASWPETLDGIETVRMEDMTAAPSSFLLRLWRMLGGEMETLDFVPPEILTFEHQSGGRKPGEVDPNDHMRSGDPEEWRDILPKDLIKQIRKDYAPLLKTYYPASMRDRKTSVAVRLPPQPLLRELEAAYTALMESRKQTATAETAAANCERRLKTVLEQRDTALASLTKRAEMLKAQRDEARARRDETSKVSSDIGSDGAESSADLHAKLKSLASERDALIDRQATLTTLKDEAVAAYKTMMQFRDDALSAEKKRHVDALETARRQFEDMKAQRDNIIADAKTRMDDMIAQRDKALEGQNDMRLQRDEAVAAVEAGLKQSEREALEGRIAELTDERDTLMAARKAASEAHKNQLEEANARFDEIKVERDAALEKDSRDTAQAVKALQERLRTAQETVNTSSAEIDTLRAKIAELEELKSARGKLSAWLSSQQ